jgi:hypothetical protein
MPAVHLGAQELDDIISALHHRIPPIGERDRVVVLTLRLERIREAVALTAAMAHSQGA